MIHAYAEGLLEYAKDNLGTAVDYSVNQLKLGGQEFLDLFVATGVAEEFASGNPRYITGMTGRSMADEIFRISGKCVPEFCGDYNGDYTPEYWCGWALAHYQWASGLSFKKIIPELGFEKLIGCYHVLHEADIAKAIEVFDSAVRSETFLARMRKSRNYTQAALAKASEVSLRSIQLYEQRKNDINKAQYNHLRSLARVLSCRVEDILEE